MNNGVPTQEDLLVGVFIQQPALLAEFTDLSLEHFQRLRPQLVFETMRNLEHRGEPITSSSVIAELVKLGKVEALSDGRGFGEHGALHYFKDLAARTPAEPELAAVRDAVATIRSDAAAALAKREAIDEAERTENYITDLALRDAVPPDPRDPKHNPRIDAFFGNDEPDEDDSEDWNIRDILPREATLWGARQKGGKTWSTLDLAIALALGEDWLGFENTRRTPIKVACYFLEDGKKRLKRRLWELCRGRGITPNDERIIENLAITREPIRIPDDAKQIAQRQKGFGPQVLIIDNLTRVMVGDPNSTKDAAAFSKSWLQLGDELNGAAILMLHHTRKPPEEARQRASDPFNTLRGSGDFAAAARHIIVSQPVDVELGAASEVHMRGNLDLRRESFVVGFERTIAPGGRHVAKLSHRGEVETFRSKSGEERKTAKELKRRSEAAAVFDRRRTVALGIVRDKGACSAYDLATALGMTNQGVTPLLKELVRTEVLRQDKHRGYVFKDEPEPERQIAMTDAQNEGVK